MKHQNVIQRQWRTRHDDTPEPVQPILDGTPHLEDEPPHSRTMAIVIGWSFAIGVAVSALVLAWML